MAQNRPDKPSITLPEDFAVSGTQAEFSSSLIESGYEASIPQILEGGNLNYMLNGLFQNTKYMRTMVDYVRDAPTGKTFWINASGQMDYIQPAVIATDTEFTTGTSTTKSPNVKQVVDKFATKQATITGAATTITGGNLTANRVLVSNSSGKVAVSAVTSTELGYLDGVTSAIQTQINGTVKTSGNQTIAGTKTFSAVTYGQSSSAVNSFITNVSITKSSSGYIELGNGDIREWGSGEFSTNKLTVNFHTPLPNSNYIVLFVDVGSEGSNLSYFKVYEKNKNYFKVQCSGSGNGDAFGWFVQAYR